MIIDDSMYIFLFIFEPVQSLVNIVLLVFILLVFIDLWRKCH
jgi:hypothetical protein